MYKRQTESGWIGKARSNGDNRKWMDREGTKKNTLAQLHLVSQSNEFRSHPTDYLLPAFPARFQDRDTAAPRGMVYVY